MTRLVRPLWDTTDRYRFAILPVRTSLDTRKREHERILDACVDRNAELAAARIHNHLATTANLIAVQMLGEPLFELVEEPLSPEEGGRPLPTATRPQFVKDSTQL